MGSFFKDIAKRWFGGYLIAAISAISIAAILAGVTTWYFTWRTHQRNIGFEKATKAIEKTSVEFRLKNTTDAANIAVQDERDEGSGQVHAERERRATEEALKRLSEEDEEGAVKWTNSFK